MSKNLNPSEIARDTLRQLALQRKLPTPDNYREIYHEIAGTEDRLPFPEGDLKAMVGVLPRQTGEQNKLGRALDAAVAARDWKKVAATLGEFIAKAGAEPPNWSGLLRTLLAKYNARHASLTTARKRDALEHVFAASATPDLLFTRLQSVLRGWEQSGVVADEADAEAPPAAERAKDGLDLREFVAHGRILRDNLVMETRDMLRVQADYVRSVCNGDKAMLESSGFELAKQREPIEKVGVPQYVTAETGKGAGEVEFRWGGVHGAHGYTMERGTMNAQGQMEWEALPFTTRTRNIITGLDSHQLYSLRVTAVGVSGPGLVSAVVQAVAA